MWTDSRSWYTKMFIMQNAAIEMHWLMVNHVSRLKKAEKPKMLVWRTEFGRGVFFLGKLNKPCGYWFCQKWLLIISKRPKKSSEWCYFNLTPPTDHGTILRRSPLVTHCYIKCPFLGLGAYFGQFSSNGISFHHELIFAMGLEF